MGAKQKGGTKAPEKKKVQKLDKKPSSGSKAKKKKWSKGKVREKSEHKSYMDATTYDKALKEIPKMTLVTPAVISERYKIRASSSKILIKELISQNLIKPVVFDSTRLFCTRVTKEAAV